MNKLGMHIHGMVPGMIEAVALLQPRTVTMMDPKAEDVLSIREASPNTFIVARKYEDGRAWQDTDPYVWAEQNYEMCDGLADGIVGWNEPFGHDDRNSCAPFDEWSYIFWAACKKLGSMEAVALCMATGNWTGAADRYKINEDFPMTTAYATYFGPHEYSWPDLQAGVGWYALRFKAWLEDIARPEARIVLTEAGLTQGILEGRDDVGWLSESPENVTADSYINTLDWYNEELCKVSQCLGCCLYDFGGAAFEWPTFEQLGLEDRIYQIRAPEIPDPEPEPPNGGETMDVRVFDMDGVELFDDEAADLVAYHGVSVLRPMLQAGDRYYGITELREKTGTAAFISCILNADGSPVANVPDIRAWWWPNMDPEANDIVTPYPTDWHTEADLGETNENGEGGSGMGTGAYHDPYTPGPHEAWVRHPTIPSELLDGIGMIGMTNHDHMDAKWQEVVWDEEEPEPEPGEPGEAMESIAIIRAELDRLEAVLVGLDAKTEAMAKQLQDMV